MPSSQMMNQIMRLPIAFLIVTAFSGCSSAETKSDHVMAASAENDVNSDKANPTSPNTGRVKLDLPPAIEIKYSGIHNSVEAYRGSDKAAEEKYLSRVKKAVHKCVPTEEKDKDATGVFFKIFFLNSKDGLNQDIQIDSPLDRRSPWAACVDKSVRDEFNANRA